MKKCILMPDSFKGTLSSIEICGCMAAGVRRHFPGCEIVSFPVADGGEGTVECFLHALPGGEKKTLPVRGPLGEPVEGFYGSFGKLAVIEMAAAAGLPLVEGRANPSLTSTYGVGELISRAIDQGAERIILGLGGSSTNDGGCGCAQALGAVFYDSTGREIQPVGGNLAELAAIDLSGLQKKLAGIELTAMCDVDTPLTGPQGAAAVFAPQKGADPAMVAALDAGLRHFAGVLQRETGLSAETLDSLPGAGAAGGFVRALTRCWTR